MKNSMPAALLLLLMAACTSIEAWADEIRIDLMSESLQESRPISIVLPPDYATSTASYPVLYVLDGREQMPHTIGTATTLSTFGEMPALIIVGIDSINRTRDMTPNPLPGVPDSGGADDFLDFLVDELQPYLAEHFRTNGYNMLAGHSFGGLLATYSLSARPDAYRARFAFSPSLRFLETALAERLKSAISSGAAGSSFFYMNVGNEQERVLEAFGVTEALLDDAASNITWKATMLPEETHYTTPVIGQFDAFRILFKDWKLNLSISRGGAEAVTEHYRKLSERVGYDVIPEEAALNDAGNEVLDVLGDATIAKALFELCLAHHPGSANAYAGLARLARIQAN